MSNGDWCNVEVHSLPAEFDVVEFDPTRQSRADIPGIDEDERVAPTTTHTDD